MSVYDNYGEFIHLCVALGLDDEAGSFLSNSRPLGSAPSCRILGHQFLSAASGDSSH